MNNSKNLITLKKTDKDFESYLWGRKSTNEIALPIQSLNIGSAHEVVTFEMIPKNSIQKPNFILFIAQLFKINRFIYVLFPFSYILANSYANEKLKDPFSIVFVFIAVMFLFVGINLRNDVVDYVSGFDRVDVSADEKPIAKGWVTASFVSKISKGCIFFSILLAIPELIIYKKLFYLFLISASLMLAGRFLDKNFYKQKKYAEFILFLLIGPILAAGLQLAGGLAINTEVIAFSLVWGLGILFLIHVNNFCTILKSSQAMISNTVTLMGFDRAKFFLTLWMLCILLAAVTHQIFFHGISFTLVALLPLAFTFYFLSKKIKNVQSPLSSNLPMVRKQALYFFMEIAVFFIFQSGSLLGVGFFEFI